MVRNHATHHIYEKGTQCALSPSTSISKKSIGSSKKAQFEVFKKHCEKVNFTWNVMPLVILKKRRTHAYMVATILKTSPFKRSPHSYWDLTLFKVPSSNGLDKTMDTDLFSTASTVKAILNNHFFKATTCP